MTTEVTQRGLVVRRSRLNERGRPAPGCLPVVQHGLLQGGPAALRLADLEALLTRGFSPVVLIVMIVALQVLAGCGPQAEPTTPGEEPAPLPEPSNASARPGGTFVFGRGGDSVGLDPITVTDGESYRVTSQ